MAASPMPVRAAPTPATGANCARRCGMALVLALRDTVRAYRRECDQRTPFADVDLRWDARLAMFAALEEAER